MRWWCWIFGHKMVRYAFCQGGMITIYRKDTGTNCHELRRCKVCSHYDAEGAEGLSWTGDLHFVDDDRGFKLWTHAWRKRI